jgi:hypothetical protein
MGRCDLVIGYRRCLRSSHTARPWAKSPLKPSAHSAEVVGPMLAKLFPIFTKQFQLSKYISFVFQIQILPNQSQNLSKFKFYYVMY